MDIKKLLIPSLAVFAVIFVLEWVLHGVILKEYYAVDPGLWRGPGSCIWPAMLIGQILFSFVFVAIFGKGYEGKGIMEGVRYGCWIALLLAANSLIFYAVQPLPRELVIWWIVGGFVEMAAAGAVLSKLYGCCGSCGSSSSGQPTQP